MSARWFVVAGLAVLLTGCGAATRSTHMGVLAGDEPLLTLIVSEDAAVVRRECPFAAAAGSVLGCQTSRTVRLPGGQTVRLVKIVRFTDRVPSPMAFEIDAHELCHAVATLQAIDDPCHAGNGGVIEAPAALPRGLLVR